MKTVKISSFLKERKIKLKPQAANCSGLQRIEKIDFSGKIYLSPVQTNTDMILVKSGDLVISGINVEKGALAIYTGEEDVLASIHYSAYEFDAEKIDIDYLKWFLKSNIFRKLLLKQTGSGIKKEIKAKHLLPIEIHLPSLNRQHEIVRQIQGVADYIEEVNQQIQQQAKYAEMLRQSILQQAVEGKLCEQDPNDEPASVLLEKIKAEKERLIAEKKIKKQKPLPPIGAEEKPFALPTDWTWCRLGELLTDLKYGTSVPCSYEVSGIPVLRIPNINTKSNCIDLNDLKFASLSAKETADLSLKNDDILLVRSNG
ncbi:MAG: restriction endonuclease subunit S, partial [Oscillospiraceae bacterium]|nr:restriction endonuclease subunit S [Oscillospiraceae bacterium]